MEALDSKNSFSEFSIAVFIARDMASRMSWFIFVRKLYYKSKNGQVRKIYLHSYKNLAKEEQTFIKAIYCFGEIKLEISGISNTMQTADAANFRSEKAGGKSAV